MKINSDMRMCDPSSTFLHFIQFKDTKKKPPWGLQRITNSFLRTWKEMRTKAVITNRSMRPIWWYDTPLAKTTKVSGTSRDIEGLNQTLEIRWELTKCIEHFHMLSKF